MLGVVLLSFLACTNAEQVKFVDCGKSFVYEVRIFNNSYNLYCLSSELSFPYRLSRRQSFCG